VANAVLDGADMVMLSGETATGDFPIDAASMMRRIICDIEKSDRYPYENIAKGLDLFSSQAHQNALALAAVRSAKDLQAKAIVVYTTSGATARLVAQYRPSVPVLAFVPDVKHQRALGFEWGVDTRILPVKENIEALLDQIDHHLQESEIVEKGETIVLLTKVPLDIGQRTNTMLLHVVGRTRPVTLIPS
jgi:pyruvate kinase